MCTIQNIKNAVDIVDALTNLTNYFNVSVLVYSHMDICLSIQLLHAHNLHNKQKTNIEVDQIRFS